MQDYISGVEVFLTQLCISGFEKESGLLVLEDLSIKNNPMISAIYFALLQSGYNYYSFGRDAKAVSKIQSFILSENCEYAFFSEIK